MNRGTLGRFEHRTTASEPFDAFVPHPLPPVPPLAIDAGLLDLLGRAERAWGALQVQTLLGRGPARR